MAVVKMKHVRFVGDADYMDEFIEKYVDDAMGIHPEYGMSVARNVKDLSSFKGENIYEAPLASCETVLRTMGVDSRENTDWADSCMTLDRAKAIISEATAAFEHDGEEKKKILAEIADRKKEYDRVSLLSGLDCDIGALTHMKFFKAHFGYMLKRNYSKLQLYEDKLDALITHVRTDGEHEYLLYVCPESAAVMVDSTFDNLLFEEIALPGDANGTPQEMLSSIQAELDVLNDSVKQIDKRSAAVVEKYKKSLLETRQFLSEKTSIYEIAKYAVFSKESFYIIGWVPAANVEAIRKKTSDDTRVMFFVDDDDTVTTTPPTKLKNPPVFRLFEPIVTMYGLPAYNELDPTICIGIIYCLMVGFMFGDVGQGLIFLLAGLYLIKKKSALGGIFAGGGVCAMFFGFMYGSIFSNEEIITPLFMNPMESGNINTMLFIGIGIGVGLLLFSMVLNIINGIKAKDLGRVLFDKNGLAGMIFYLVVIGTVISVFLAGKMFVSLVILVVMIAIPFVLIYFKEPLSRIIEKKKAMPDGAGNFFIEGTFDMIEMLLSFATNTISFVRLSAFAINHVGLSMAFNILANMTSNPVLSTLILIIGNAAIIVLEGMVVGIQGLRLSYYELFSRFYSGDGIEYKPITGKK